MDQKNFTVLRRWVGMLNHHTELIPLPKRSNQNLYQFLRNGSHVKFSRNSPPFALVMKDGNGCRITSVCNVLEWDFDIEPYTVGARVLTTAHVRGVTRVLQDLTFLDHGLTVDRLTDRLAWVVSSIESIRDVGLELVTSLREL